LKGYPGVEEVDRKQYGEYGVDLVPSFYRPCYPYVQYNDDMAHLASEEVLCERSAVRRCGGVLTEYCMPDPSPYMLQNLSEREIGEVWRNGPYSYNNIVGFYELMRPAAKKTLHGTYGGFKQSWK